MSWTTVCDLPMDGFQGNRAIDTTVMGNDGELLGTAGAHAGYVSFPGGDAQVEIPVRDDSLTRFVGLRVQALVRPAAITHRFDLVEGWMSFALVIESDGRLVGTVYDGQQWSGPDSGATLVPTDEWSRVCFEYDGVSIASLTLNGTRVGIALDMPPAMAQPQEVIALGHWPRGDGRYSLQGNIGHVRIERRDYHDFTRDAMEVGLCRRRLTAAQADAMREIDYLAHTLDPRERAELLRCVEAQSARLRALLRTLRGLQSGEEGSLPRLAERLRAAWCCSLDAPAARQALLEYFRSLAGTPGSPEDQRFRALLEEFFDIAKMCSLEGPVWDRVRELCGVLFPELCSFEIDLRQLADAV